MDLKKTYSTIGILTLLVVNFINPSVALAATTGNLYPSSNGTYQTWPVNPSTEAAYVALNDYGNCTSYNDYVYTTSTGAKDSFFIDLSSIPDGSRISSINAIPCAVSVSTTQPLQLFYRTQFNGTYIATESNFSTSTLVGTTKQEYATSTQVYLYWPPYIDSRPTKTATSTLEIGFYKTTSTQEIDVHQLRVQISYQ